ncbi:TetR family transcriptional regulator [Streptomyces viridochromogenes DSM 40736]|uniref:TetR family transcriptional regulator n=1 Tax=Streptomyces viridochromogenes (strain DSM 40736 / JCM 4977 / BCRC 1201 / Tue 494) TaxID=591159 RepID=D9XHY2_STRVT|nr:TetR family transcriptional regulator [Streptomyces viridochromogenes DSM 40736]
MLERARTALLAALPPAEVSGGDVAQRLDIFLVELGDAFQRHPRGVKLLLGLGKVRQDASAAAVAEVRHYRDALVAWARDAVSSVFALRDRPVHGAAARRASVGSVPFSPIRVYAPTEKRPKWTPAVHREGSSPTAGGPAPNTTCRRSLARCVRGRGRSVSPGRLSQVPGR